MIRYECDRCAARMTPNDARRYIVRMEIYAAAGHVDLDADEERDPAGALGDVVRALAMADPDEVEDQTYRGFRFDVCDTCRKLLLECPLGRSHPKR